MKRDFVDVVAVGIQERNPDLYLMKRRGLLGEENFRVLWMLKDYLKSEGASIWHVYTTTFKTVKFALFLKEFGETILTAKPLHIRLFLSQFRNRDTVRRYAAAIKKLYKFLYETTEDERYQRLYSSFKMPSFRPEDYPLPALPSTDEVLLLINHAVQPHKSILALAYEGGLRRSEILLLKVKDVIDCGDYIKITVRNSKSKPRTVIIVQFRDIIRDWLKRHKWRNDPEALLFPARTKGPYRPMKASTIYNYLLKLKKRLGVKRRIYLHLLRHLRATELFKEGLRERELMEYFGWKTRTMIDIYSHISEKDVHRRILELYGIEPRPKTVREVKEVEEAKALIDRLIQLALQSPELLKSLLSNLSQADRQ